MENKKRYWIRDIVIKPRTPKWERQLLEKKEAEEYLAIHKSERHPIVKKYHKLKHFLKWAIKLIVPDFLIGHPNLWDNLKTLRKHPQFKPLRMALFAWLIFAVTFGALGIYSLNQAVRVFAVSPVTDTFTDETKIATSTNITVSGGQVKLSVIPPWACGDNVTFTYKGVEVTYGTVSSQGECWLDRNLGASQVATAYNDSAAYGDLFQWGRLDDGHQTRTSGTQTGLSSSDDPGHSNFIYGMGSPYDWRSPQNNNLWQGVSGTNNPCPSGWRIPTETELNTERASWAQQNYNGAYASPLKLTAGGYRLYSNASLYLVGSRGYYWSSTVSTTDASYLYFASADAYLTTFSRASGYSVRCVQD